MSTLKSTLIQLGHGSPVFNHSTSRIFASTKQIGLYSSAATYDLNCCTEFSGAIYRSLITQTGVQPDSSANWEIVYLGVRDGDICVAVDNALDIQQRISGFWQSIAGRPTVKTLSDNQVAPVIACTYPAAFKAVRFEYELQRANGNSRTGVVSILTDGVSQIKSTESYQELADVGVSLYAALNAGQIEVSYTSTNQAMPITLKYSIQGW